MTGIDPSSYDQFGDAYANKLEATPIHTHYARPATLALIGDDLAGQRVLDAGCGDGWYARQLAGRGADVTAIDGSDAMLAHARARSPATIQFQRADLGSALPFADASFDLVLSALAIHYMRDYRALFGEFARVLRVGGKLVITTHHVVSEVTTQNPADYFATEIFEDQWPGVGKVQYWRRPLSDVLQPLLDSGFAFEQIVEPQPLPSLQEINPTLYHELSTRPQFLFLRATRA
ncbi:class I SAM-dependent methyltransferase [Roseiterribacter gracilis]|uniref:SAM-dependent methyltransferase n=1 Tax=Roseiterribacter gracilis TaxID=2812848 RepID=A0A8S8XDR8_9PROT|nr:SAM-dependent methyltransferase [Rhodospirillales bacterium TMPK1]